jgi:hypothetical protein
VLGNNNNNYRGAAKPRVFNLRMDYMGLYAVYVDNMRFSEDIDTDSEEEAIEIFKDILLSCLGTCWEEEEVEEAQFRARLVREQ